MHDFTAITIVGRAALLDILRDGGPVVVDVEQKIGTYLSDQQLEHLYTALATLEHELSAPVPDHDVREAIQVLTDHAYAAQEKPEIDG